MQKLWEILLKPVAPSRLDGVRVVDLIGCVAFVAVSYPILVLTIVVFG